jgi:hypothetical protein
VKISEQLDNVEKKIGGQFDVIMCAATLVAHGELKLDDTMQSAKRYWEETLGEDCFSCPCTNSCLVCRREE